MIEFVTLSETADVAIVSCGYESRSRFLVESGALKASRHIVLAFEANRLEAYERNLAFFKRLPGSVILEDSRLRELPAVLDGLQPKSVAVDLSTMDRSMIAETYYAIAVSGARSAPEGWFYAVADFTPPPLEQMAGPTTFAGPVAPFFAGLDSDFTKPAVPVIGIGYEPGKALGVLDYLEADSPFVFLPTGPDERYEAAVRKSNAELLSEIDTARIVQYDVLDPVDLVDKLEQATYAAELDGRPLLVPLGPKVFVLASLLVSELHGLEPAVWRFSAGDAEPVRDRSASGRTSTIGFRRSVGASVLADLTGGEGLGR